MSLEVWTVEDVATELRSVGAMLRAEAAMVAAAPARLCLRARCEHTHERGWSRPPSRR